MTDGETSEYVMEKTYTFVLFSSVKHKRTLGKSKEDTEETTFSRKC